MRRLPQINFRQRSPPNCSRTCPANCGRLGLLDIIDVEASSALCREIKADIFEVVAEVCLAWAHAKA